MNITTDKINEYLKYLECIEEIKKDKFEEICNFIKLLNPEDIATNKKEIATLFCRSIGKINQGTEIENSSILLLAEAFKSIMNMEADLNSQIDTNVLIIKFLQNLWNLGKSPGTTIAMDAYMYEQFNMLVENLECIRILFQIQMEGMFLFPIGKLLAEVINEQQFKIDKLDIKTINMLLLALQVFKVQNYANASEKVKSLVVECNLRCLEYLGNPRVSFFDDNTWKSNFEKNGVLILANREQKKILIRHEDYNYFLDSPYDIQSECNMNHIDIAYYIEYDYEENEEFTTVEEIFEGGDSNLIIDTLELIYQKKYCNLFFKGSLINKNGELKPTNIFGHRDCNIIYYDGKTDKNYNSEINNIEKIIQKYSLQVLRGKGIDCITVGTILKLLTFENISTSMLFKQLSEDTKNLQNKFILTWLSYCDNQVDKLNYLQDLYLSKLEYTNNRNSFKNKEFEDVAFYPIALDKLIVENVAKHDVGFYGEFVKVKISKDFDGNPKFQNIISGEYVSYDNICILDKEDENEFIDAGRIIYLMYNEVTKKLNISATINRIGSIREKIMENNKYLLPIEIFDFVTESEVKEVLEYMRLHERALKDISNEKSSFDSNARFRLANNLLYNKVCIKEKWNKFMIIIELHEKIDFSYLQNNQFIDLDEEGVLFIPKEDSSADSALCAIYNNYIKKPGSRNGKDIYKQEIKFDGSKYFVNGKEITKVYFLFDTLQHGNATIESIEGYFMYYGEENIKTHKNRAMKLYCEGKEISLARILNKNNPEKKILCFFGNEIGKLRVERYFEDPQNPYCILHGIKLEFDKTISRTTDEDIIKLGNEIFGEINIGIGSYLVIREFNQPKQNVFPKGMLDKNKVISLFVQKKELII